MIGSLTRSDAKRRHAARYTRLSTLSSSASLPLPQRLLTRCLLVGLVVLTVLLVYQHTDSLEVRHTRADKSYTIGAYATRSGLRSGTAPLESTVLMLFTPNTTRSLHEAASTTTATTPVTRDFDDVAEAYLASSQANASSAFFDFFARHRATLWEVNERTRLAQPMRLDIVFTHVEPATASFARHVRARRGGDEPHCYGAYLPFLGAPAVQSRRWRDWQELRYALRALHVHALHSPALAQHEEFATRRTDCAFLRHTLHLRVSSQHCPTSASFTVHRHNETVLEGHALLPSPLIRYIYLVVAEEDQVPRWLNRSAFPALRVVLHSQLYTTTATATATATAVLPTLNSLSIETTLHRIAGLSRFFVYFNDDMLLGRRLSFFDLFRPLSPSRQLLQLGHVLHAKEEVKEEERDDDDYPVAHVDNTSSKGWDAFVHALHTYTQRTQHVAASSGRRVVWLEPVLHSDGWAAAGQSIAACYDAQHTQVHSAYTTNAGQTAQKDTCWPRRLTQRMPRPNTRNVMDRYARYLVLSALEGVAPTMTYAHLPSLLDRHVLHTMLEDSVDGFADEAAATRRAFLREQAAFSPMHLYVAYALSMRRARARYLWWQLIRDAPHGVQEEMQGDEEEEDDKYCSLCGDTNAVNLQRPDVLYQLCRGTQRVRPDACARVQRVIDGLTASNISAEASVHRSRNRRWRSLMNDVYHHSFDDGDETMFVMARDALHLSIALLSLQRHIAEHGAPLFTTLNDDFHGAQAQPATTPVRNMQLFALYMRTATNATTPAPWEY